MTKKNIPTSYSHALEILNGKYSKNIRGICGTRLENNRNGSIVMYYHNTPVVSFHQNGNISLNSGGYRTRTTKDRINKALNNKAKVYQYKYDWYIQYLDGNITHPFMDGITV